MYESPIQLYVHNIYQQMMKQQEEKIYEVVLEYVPDVNKEELLRALQYDRGQYEKGYADGKRDAMDELVRCKDCKWGELDDPDFPLQYLCHFEGDSWNKADHYCSYGERKVEEDNG